MVKSMTGYGRAEETVNGCTITVELRSVNNRYLDCNVRIPRLYLFAEESIKSRVQNTISRGKVDVFVTLDGAGAEEVRVSVNRPLAQQYANALQELAQLCGPTAYRITPETLSRFPEVLMAEKAEENVEEKAQDICRVLDLALADFDQMRSREGQRLEEDILSRARTIEELVGRVEERSPQTVSEYRAKLEARMNEVLANTQLDPARILTEAAIFADKVAVDEETVRLRSHIGQLRTMLDKGGAVGRKLDFLIQEFNREANTIGSKCSDIEIARHVVDIKAEIEKIREQIQNMEEGGARVKLINIGFGNMVSAGRLIAIVSPDSAPIKRMVQEARDRGVLIDATYGRRTRAVLIMDNDHLVLSALQTETVANRLAGEREADDGEEELE